MSSEKLLSGELVCLKTSSFYFDSLSMVKYRILDWKSFSLGTLKIFFCLPAPCVAVRSFVLFRSRSACLCGFRALPLLRDVLSGCGDQFCWTLPALSIWKLQSFSPRKFTSIILLISLSPLFSPFCLRRVLPIRML